MDLNAKCDSDPARITFRFSHGGQVHTGWVGLNALAAFDGQSICSVTDAIEAYQRNWEAVHAAAAALRAAGQKLPYVNAWL